MADEKNDKEVKKSKTKEKTDIKANETVSKSSKKSTVSDGVKSSKKADVGSSDIDLKKNKTKSVKVGVSKKNSGPSVTYHGVGRRKSSVARAYLCPGNGNILVNGKDYKDFFKHSFLYYRLLNPLKLLDKENEYDIKINVFGGGLSSQVDAIRLSISICLSKVKLEYKSILKDVGFLTTDSRVVERKKFGHKKARRSFQFTKR